MGAYVPIRSRGIASGSAAAPATREVALLYLPSHLPVQLLCRVVFTRLFVRHK